MFQINDEFAHTVVIRLLYLQHINSEEPIHMIIDSPGGDLAAGLRIYAIMQNISAPIHTICIGQALGVAAILLCGGKRGNRVALPTVSIRLHQSSDCAQVDLSYWE
jgi:ATP-dependent Clp protease protease subunit